MKRILAFLYVFIILLTLCSCEKMNFSELYSALNETIEKEIFLTEDIVEIKYEEYEIREPQFTSCYNSLNSKQREFYRSIYSVSQEMTEGFVKIGYNYNGADKDVNIAYRAFLYDNPDIFWMPKDYILGTSSKGENQKLAISFEYKRNGKENHYKVTKSEKTKMQEELNSVCEKILRKTENLSNDYEKEKYINDLLCDNTNYSETAEFSDTAYGALVKGKALCEGYSKAFMLLCNKAGIECELIVGESENQGHMWNRVNIDKKLSYVDVTWNDRSEHRTYTYFNITESQLLADHSLAPLLSSIGDGSPKSLFNFTQKDCSFTGNTFYEKSGRVLWRDYADTASKEIEKAKKKGENYAEFLFKTENIISEFKSDPEKFITNIQNRLTSAVIIGYSNERDTVILYFE